MINKKVEEAINTQINKELWSGYLYLSMAMNFENAGLSGIANWFRVQAKEEEAHAEIFINYLNSRGGRVRLQAIEAVPEDWETPLAAFEHTLEHEQKVTAMINDLYALAEAERDYATRGKLDWFVSEQVEEEENARGFIDRLRLVGNDGMALYSLDQELAQRTFIVPAPLAATAAN